MKKSKAKVPPNVALRAQLRDRIAKRLEETGMPRADAATSMNLTLAQVSRLCNDTDAFSLDRLVNAAEGIGLKIELRAVRPYSKG